MRTHVLTVAERDISTDDRLLYKGTKDEDRVSLVLDDEWEGLDILVAFKGSDVVSAPARGADGYYVIPWEVMTKIGDVFVSIEGTNADGQVLLHAAMSEPFRVIETGAGFEGYDPTYDLVTEAIKEAKEATAKALESRIIHAEAETLDPDSEATANLVPEGGAQCLRLGIPKGDRGDSDFGILDIDDDGYLNAHYTTDKPSIRFELDGNDLRTVLEIADN